MSVSYPSVIYGDNFEAQKLNTVGRRSGMSCIYKVLLKGEKKRAGVYIQDSFDRVFIINVGGDNFQVDLEANTITYNPRYSGKYGALVNDPKFMEVIQLTLVRFGHIKVIDGQFSAPPPRLVILTEEEQESIGDFGIF